MTLIPWVEFQTGTSDWKYYLNLKIQRRRTSTISSAS